MRKILLLLSFFLWTCGGSESSSPTEPDNNGNTNGTLDAISTGGISEILWDGQYLKIKWNPSIQLESFDRYEIREYTDHSDPNGNTGFKTIFNSSNINSSEYIYELTKNNFTVYKSYSLFIYNKNGSYDESVKKYPQLWEIKSDAGNSRLREIHVTDDGGFIASSYDGSWFPAGSENQSQLIKFGTNLNIESRINFDSLNGYLDLTSEGGYIIGLQGNGSNHVLVKTDSQGNIIWGKNGQELQGSGDAGGSTINDVETVSDGFLFTINRGEFSVGKVNLSGETDWYYELGWNNGGTAKAIKQINQTSFVAVGHAPYQDNNGNDKQTAFMVIFDNNGNKDVEFFEHISDFFYDVKILNNNDILVVGSLHHDYSTPYRYMDHGLGGYLARFDNQGNMLWSYIRQDTDVQINFRDVIEKNDGNLIVGGHRLIQSGNSSGDKQAYLVELDSDGNEIFDFVLDYNVDNPSSIDIIHSLIQTDDGKTIVVALRQIAQRGFVSFIYKLIEF